MSPIAAPSAARDRGGFVLGVCNGFQILTELGLLPGALTQNAHFRFECRQVHVAVTSEGPFTPRKGEVGAADRARRGALPGQPELLRELEGEGRVGLRYATTMGEVTPQANPNGSAPHIAGIYGGAKKNVFGLMPHPERMCEPSQGGTDGRRALRGRPAL